MGTLLKLKHGKTFKGIEYKDGQTFTQVRTAKGYSTNETIIIAVDSLGNEVAFLKNEVEKSAKTNKTDKK